jgi:hypothetical protein
VPAGDHVTDHPAVVGVPDDRHVHEVEHQQPRRLAVIIHAADQEEHAAKPTGPPWQPLPTGVYWYLRGNEATRGGAMTEFEFGEYLTELLTADADENGKDVRVETFENLGLMTRNDGLAVRLDDGTEFQLTIVRSK